MGPGQIRNAGQAGAFDLRIDLTSLPQPADSVAAVAGETWNFTSWYRDTVGGDPTSNFTNGLSVNFQ